MKSKTYSMFDFDIYIETLFKNTLNNLYETLYFNSRLVLLRAVWD